MQDDLLSLRLRRDPYPEYARLREQNPVYRNEAGAWIVTRYDHARSALCDRRLSHWTGSGDGLSKFDSTLGRWVRLMDPNTSTHLRGMVASSLAADGLDSIEQKMRVIIRDRLNQSRETRCLDIVTDIAQPMTMAVVANLLGVPPEEEAIFEQYFSQVKSGIFDYVGGARSGADDSAAFHFFSAYILELAERKRVAPGGDLISALIRARNRGDDIGDSDYVAFAMIFLFAAQENISNFIGNAMLALITNPGQWELLRNNCALLSTAVEELLRFDSPVQFVNLVARDDLDIAGRAINRGEQVLICVGSANRDPQKFPDPGRLDITRDPIPHLTFGAGALYCIGASLARLEARLVVEQLVGRFPPMETEPSRLEWRSSPAVLRGLISLPVRFQSEAADLPASWQAAD